MEETKIGQNKRTTKAPISTLYDTPHKFNIGDWITDGYLHCKISNVLDDRYIVDTKFAKRSAILFKCEHNYHLWTIQDAKDGDILTSIWKGCSYIYIFKEVENNIIISHIFYYPELDAIDMGVINMDNTPTFPATKAQRDILFAKMLEAGYEWDAEKKVSRKIEQKSKRVRIKDATGTLKEMLDNIDPIELEETRREMLEVDGFDADWKPSEEQMKALKEACDEHWEPDGLDPLYELYEQLKKYKNEISRK